MTTISIAIYNPNRHDREKAWAYVFNEDHAMNLGKSNGYFSVRVDKLSDYENSANGRLFMASTPRIGATKDTLLQTINILGLEAKK